MIYYTKLKSCLSVLLTFTLISQPCQHRLKWDLIERKAESFGPPNIFYKSTRVITHPHEYAKGTGVS